MFYLMQWLVSLVFDRAAQSRQRAKSRKPRDMDDEWVNPWTRQQHCFNEALARAQQQNSPNRKSSPENVMESAAETPARGRA